MTALPESLGLKPQRRQRRAVLEKVAIEFDRLLYRLVRDGRRATDPKTGTPLLDADQKPVYIQPLSSDLMVVRSRLRDVGIRAVDTRDEKSAWAELMERARSDGWRFPSGDALGDDDADDEGTDDATGKTEAD